MWAIASETTQSYPGLAAWVFSEAIASGPSCLAASIKVEGNSHDVHNHLSRPTLRGFCGRVLTSEFQARVTLERLRREGYEVTSTEPRLARAPTEPRAAPV